MEILNAPKFLKSPNFFPLFCPCAHFYIFLSLYGSSVKKIMILYHEKCLPFECWMHFPTLSSVFFAHSLIVGIELEVTGWGFKGG